MLGSEAPAVKGMNPIQFAEGESDTFKFEEVPAFAQDFAVDYFKAKAEKAENKNSKLENDLNAEKKKTKNFEDQNQEIQFEQRKADFVSFYDQGIEEGKLKPVLKEKAIAVFTHLDSLDTKEGEDNPVDAFKEIINELKAQINFGESYTSGESETGELSATEIAGKAVEYQEEQRKLGKVISTSQAVNYVTNQKKDSK